MCNRVVQRDVNSIKTISGKELQVMKRPDNRLTLSIYFYNGVEHAVLLERNAIELTRRFNKMYPRNESESEKCVEFDFIALDGQIVKFTKYVSGQMSIIISDIDQEVKPIIVSIGIMDAIYFRNVLNSEYGYSGVLP